MCLLFLRFVVKTFVLTTGYCRVSNITAMTPQLWFVPHAQNVLILCLPNLACLTALHPSSMLLAPSCAHFGSYLNHDSPLQFYTF